MSVQGNGSSGFDTIIIGGGQAGLSVGYHLSRLGRPFLILDSYERIGDSWRKRWDSLRLFTPAKFDGLDGMRFPAPSWSFPTKDEMADYLEAYAERFALPVRTQTPVDRLSRESGRFVITAGDRRYETENVVVATGAFRAARVPEFAADLHPGVLQLHSSEYRSPSDLQEGGVLVVGAGNSGAEIAFEIAQTHPTWLSGKSSGQIPARHGAASGRVAFRIVRFLGHHVLTVRTPIGRKVRPKFIKRAAPLIRVKEKDLARAGVQRVPRVSGARNGMPLLADGGTLEVANIVWCTGFRHDFPWIDLPVFDEKGDPVHRRGVVASEPGLYFAGLKFQFAASSDVLPGIGRDAAYIARHIGSRRAAASPATWIAPVPAP